jgi:dihydropteroate synthase
MNWQDWRTWRIAFDKAIVKESTSHPVTTLIMGIVNMTPDSFSDGGRYNDVNKAYDRVMRMVDEGADIIDIGGESSRPYSNPISVQEECDRIFPLIDKLQSNTDCLLSVDTMKSDVMAIALNKGIRLINDISALSDPKARLLIQSFDAHVILMHKKGDSLTMQNAPEYPNGVCQDVMQFFTHRLAFIASTGISLSNCVIDVGFGFGKTTAHNLTLIKHLRDFSTLKLPMLIGLSNKASIGELLNKPPHQRLYGSLALTAFAQYNGAHIIRTHDISPVKDVMTVVNALKQIN